jgi:hypothetical protein
MAPSHKMGDCLIRARKSEAIYRLRIQDQARVVHLALSLVSELVGDGFGRARLSSRAASEAESMRLLAPGAFFKFTQR